MCKQWIPDPSFLGGLGLGTGLKVSVTYMVLSADLYGTTDLL